MSRSAGVLEQDEEMTDGAAAYGEPQDGLYSIEVKPSILNTCTALANGEWHIKGKLTRH